MESNWKWKPRRAFICGSMNIFMRNSRSKCAAKERQSSRDRADSKGPHTLTLNNVVWKIEQSMLWSSQAKTWHDDGRRVRVCGNCLWVTAMFPSLIWPQCLLWLFHYSVIAAGPLPHIRKPQSMRNHFLWFHWILLSKPLKIHLWKQTNKQTIFSRKKNYLLCPNNTRYSISESRHHS